MGQSAAKALIQKRRNRSWWVGLHDKMGEQESQLVSDLLIRRNVKVDKLLESLNTALDKFLAFDEHELGAADPDVMSTVESVEKRRQELMALLEHLIKKVEWPKGSKGVELFKDELKVLRGMDPFHTLIEKDTGRQTVVSQDLKGRDVEPEMRLLDKQSGSDRGRMRMAILEWKRAQERAHKLKLEYAAARMEAKEALEKFEKLAMELSPEYVARKIDWSDAGNWDKLGDRLMSEAQAALKATADRRQAFG